MSKHIFPFNYISLKHVHSCYKIPYKIEFKTVVLAFETRKTLFWFSSKDQGEAMFPILNTKLFFLSSFRNIFQKLCGFDANKKEKS